MLSFNDYQRAYRDIYVNMRNYIWGVDVVEILANFEVAVYDTFMDKATVQKYFSRLVRAITALDIDDDDLQKSLDNFQKLLDSDEEIYAPLYKVNEILEEV